MEAPFGGKLVIGVIVALAIFSAWIAHAYHRGMQRRPIEYWGPKDATLIVHASNVEALLLSPAEEDAADLHVGGMSFHIDDVKNVERAPGFSHLRRSLLNHRAFEWDERPVLHRRNARYALRFIDGAQTLVVIFDSTGTAIAAELREPVSIAPIQEGVRDFFAEQFTSANE